MCNIADGYASGAPYLWCGTDGNVIGYGWFLYGEQICLEFEVLHINLWDYSAFAGNADMLNVDISRAT